MNAKWITAVPVSDTMSMYIFQKKFTLKGKADSFNVKISADTRYRFFLNGNELAHGPCKSTPGTKYYEELECTNAIIEGENAISVAVLHIPPFATRDNFITAYHKESPALYFDGILKCGNEKMSIISDETFSVFRANHISFTYYDQCMPSIAPFEIVKGSDDYEKLICEVMYTPSLSDNCFSKWGVKEPYHLKKRPIQNLEIKPKTLLDTVREYYDEFGNYNIIFDAGYYTTAMLHYEYKASKNTKISAIYSECSQKRTDDGSFFKDMRDDSNGYIGYGNEEHHRDVFIASGHKQNYEPFWYRAFRFIRVECSKKPEYFRISAARYTYDFEKDSFADGVGSFICSDKKYTKLWEISRNTLECCTHETFVDCPYYEQQQYIGDGRFESLYAWALSNDCNMQKKLLKDTANSMQTDGQISTTSPTTWVQIIHGSNFYFIDCIRKYLLYTGDIAFVRTLIGVITSIIEYFESTKTSDGLIFPPDGCYFLDWTNSWKNGFPDGGDKNPMAIYNLMYASALKDAVEICDSCGYKGLGLDYRNFYNQTVDAINKHFFDKEIGLYTDVVGTKLYSEHAAVWAIISDAITSDAAKEMAEKIITCDFAAKSSFSKCYDLLRALDKVGLYEKYAHDILNQWDTMLDKHCTTWCESLSFPRSECHGWSCIPMYEMSSMILGVSPIENGFKKVRIKPITMGLEYAKGRVPTTFGYIDIFWTYNERGSFSLEINSNVKIEMEIILPSGKIVTTKADHCMITE